MKKITLTLTDVDVSIVKFVDQDAYSDFPDLDGRKVEEVNSPLDEIDSIRKTKPIVFAKQPDGTYLVIKHKSGVLVG